jgi:hypothetical protein
LRQAWAAIDRKLDEARGYGLVPLGTPPRMEAIDVAIERLRFTALEHRGDAARQAFDALSGVKKLNLIEEVFEILEYDEDGNPGGQWSSDTTQSLGELFNRYGVKFTDPTTDAD